MKSFESTVCGFGVEVVAVAGALNGHCSISLFATGLVSVVEGVIESGAAFCAGGDAGSACAVLTSRTLGRVASTSSDAYRPWTGGVATLTATSGVGRGVR